MSALVSIATTYRIRGTSAAMSCARECDWAFHGAIDGVDGAIPGGPLTRG
jgi:hypothetical protein